MYLPAASHSLSKYQKMEKMMKLPFLGDRKPSIMLAELLEYCLAGESVTAAIAYLFMQQLDPGAPVHGQRCGHALGTRYKQLRIPSYKAASSTAAAASRFWAAWWQDQAVTSRTSMCYYHAKFGKQACTVRRGPMAGKLGCLGVILAVCRPAVLYHGQRF